MKKIYFPTGIFITVCLFIFQGCIKPPKDFDPRNADNVYSGCRVKKTVSFSGDETSSPTTRIFEYNSNNDPVSVKSDKTATGNPDLFFKYDNKHRLIEFVGLYTGGTSYEYLHRYTWQNNRIAIDSEYGFGVYGIQPGKDARAAFHYFSYDNLGRIIQDSVVFINVGLPNQVLKTEYTPTGNFGGVYDDKLNLHRTNKVWMFIDRDYSVNNSGAPSAYNNAGLPLHYGPPAQKFGINCYFGHFYYAGTTDIIYDCR